MSDAFDLTPGPRDHLITEPLAGALAVLGDGAFDSIPLESANASDRLTSHLATAIRRAIAIVGEEPGDDASPGRQVQAANVLLVEIRRLSVGDAGADGAPLAGPARVLRAIRGRLAAGSGFAPPPRAPVLPFGRSDLLVNGSGQPNIGSELQAELATALNVDLLCAFVIWSGVRQLREQIRGVIDRGGRVRVITTTYMGATEPRAVEELSKLGAEVRIAFDARTTKLHAKAWLLERPAGMSTAFIGSSNLSHTALFDGLEWNVRLSTQDAAHVIERVRTVFESYWADDHFEPFDGADPTGCERLVEALGRGRIGGTKAGSQPVFTPFDLRPYPHQQRMLDALEVERTRHDRHRNLVVAATGTGKTVVAAFDYERLARASTGAWPSLLFVAHRAEILEQARETYARVLRDPSFGSIQAAGSRAKGRHVFATIQSLTQPQEIDPGSFDVVVIDEFHHAAGTADGSSYGRLLNHLRPVELLGLTATPERMDGADVLSWFGGRIAVELRLWEAIDQGFLVPFQYFGVADGTDLSSITWRRGAYDVDELERLYTGDDLRVRRTVEALRRVVAAPEEMRALGFCVSVRHAIFMARRFTELGLPSVALSGHDQPDVRASELARLRRGELRCVFSVDVLGEGVDLPSVDTLLLLRPTQSTTVFTQQLGRGLRTEPGKSHLTVLDMIGQQHRGFRFDQRLAAIVDRRRGSVREQVEQGFPFLPSGCSMQLERKAEETILENLRLALRETKRPELVRQLRALARDGSPVAMPRFLQATALSVDDVYRGASDNTWTDLRRKAGLEDVADGASPEDATERHLLRAVRRLRYVDDAERVSFYRALLGSDAPPDTSALDERERRLLRMLAWSLWERHMPASVPEAVNALWRHDAVRGEIVELLGVLDAEATTVARPGSMPAEIPLSLHARYSRTDVVAALRTDAQAPGRPPKLQAGILWEPSARTDVFFIDLRKNERDYSPTTMYRDYAISRDLFHWESQSRQHTGQATVQRYIRHVEEGTNVLLMAREHKRDEIGETAAYVCLGLARYVSHVSERPVRFTWRLQVPMPEELFEVARSVAVA